MNNEEMDTNLTHDDISLEDKEIIRDNKWAITKLFDLYSGLFLYRLKYGRRFKNDTTIIIYIDHKDYAVTEISMRFIGDLEDPVIVSKILLFLNENYSKLGVSKKDFDDKFTKFLALYLGREKTQMISTRVDYATEMEKTEKAKKVKKMKKMILSTILITIQRVELRLETSLIHGNWTLTQEMSSNM